LPGTCVIFNPVAKGDKARRFHRHLGELADDCVFRPTTGPGMARELARGAVEDGFEVVAAAGGDGTVNEVLNGIGDAPEGFSRAALGVIPLGTANVFARELKIPLRLVPCWSVLRAGKTDTVDLVRATYQSKGQTVQRWFVQVAGAGLDARAVELVDWNLKKRTGFLAYVVAGLRALKERQPLIITVANGTESRGELVLLGNGRLYGGPFGLFPQANLRNGRLDFRTFPRANWWTVLAALRGVLTGRFEQVNGAPQESATTLELRANQRVPLQIDGEPAGELPARFEVAPRALRVIVP
jgi:YegS/Rv2252/BmrU family lipid kinase